MEAFMEEINEFSELFLGFELSFLDEAFGFMFCFLFAGIKTLLFAREIIKNGRISYGKAVLMHLFIAGLVCLLFRALMTEVVIHSGYSSYAKVADVAALLMFLAAMACGVIFYIAVNRMVESDKKRKQEEDFRESLLCQSQPASSHSPVINLVSSLNINNNPFNSCQLELEELKANCAESKNLPQANPTIIKTARENKC